jgi:hypothetical protein
MRLPSLHSRFRATRQAIGAVVVALIVAVAGFEAAVHAHVPAVDGWHDATPHGDTARDQGLSSCSICRLAHETSSGPVAPGTVSAPLLLITPRSIDRFSVVLPVLSAEHSPRAPPCLASC